MRARINRFIDGFLSYLFPPVKTYTISPEVLATMQSMARQTHPKEAFGVITGKVSRGKLNVTGVVYQPFINTERSAEVSINKYAISDFVGSFHSHPTPHPYPSAADKRMFMSYPGVHGIIAYPYKEVHMFDKDGQRIGIHPV